MQQILERIRVPLAMHADRSFSAGAHFVSLPGRRFLRVCCGTRRKRRPGKDTKCAPAEKERSACIAKGTRILSRICCMPGDWRKRLYGEFVWGLRSYLETRCSDRVWGFRHCRPGGRGTCSWAAPMCGLSTSLPIARMNSAHSATRDSYLIMNGTQSVVCVETTCS